MRSVPFYGNRADNSSCMLACFRSLVEYWEKDKYSWRHIEDLTGYTTKPVWSVQAWTGLARRGYDVRLIEFIDYERLYSEKMSYLEEVLDAEELRWQFENSNILSLPDILPEFLKLVHREKRSPTLSDIDYLLSQDYLVTVTVNSRTLNNQKGYVSHMITLLGKEQAGYVAHDPGPPGKAHRIIPRGVLWSAMGGSGNHAEVTGAKKVED